MKKLSDFKGEEAFDLLEDLIDPMGDIFSNNEFLQALGNDNKKALKSLLRNNRKAVVEVLARLNEVPVEDFHYNIATLTIQCLALMNDKELLSVFTSQGQIEEEDASGSATENTQEAVKE